MVDDSERTPPPARWRTPVRVGAAVLPLMTCAILSTFRDSVTAAIAVLILVLGVVAAAATGDRLSGLLAALSGAVWFDFFLTAPYETFAISDPDNIEATVLFLLIGAAVTEIALWGNRQRAGAARRFGYLEGVLGAARIVSEGDTPTSTLVEVVGHQITDVLGADDCRFIAGSVLDGHIALLDHDGVITRDGHDVDVDRVGLPYNEQIALPVRRGRRVLGHFVVTAATRLAYPSIEQRQVAVLLADQVAAALDAE